MVNSAEFSKRLQKIMDQHDLNASSFAERIHVGRSSISHIISGRNKPSLDFVINTVKEFPEVDLYWLLNGKGTYPKSEEKKASAPSSGSTSENVENTPPSKELVKNKAEDSNDLFSPVQTENTISKTESIKGKNIQKVILLYDDGSFEYFIP
ncbi:helix-turn-helix domain-containing protein [Nonlabens dokdonensis]|jgi:transcriptional regulator with XRE-family HTH domain|nr:helix-turn-helix transcriptional regulator [Nonlabens dokdonensis]AGC78111.1 putative transcriptional regulator [Nonlabens dokdonensis DSW-6]